MTLCHIGFKLLQGQAGVLEGAAVWVAVAALEEDATLQDVLGLLGMDRFQGKRPEGEMNALPDGMVDPTEAPQN